MKTMTAGTMVFVWIAVAMNVAPAQGVLVAHYTFDDGTADDQSGQGNDGTIVGNPSLVPGFLGAALVFDGSDDYVVVPDSPDLRLQGFTITAWIRVDATPSSAATILEKWQNDQGYRLVVDGKGGSVRFIVSGGADAQHSVGAPFSLMKNVWTTVSVTYNGSDLRLYLDGLLVDQTTTPTLDIVNQADLFLAGGVDPPQLFDGAVDEITIENTPAMELTVCEAAGKIWHAQSQTCIERFSDITADLSLGDEDHQHFGIAMVDVNDDGWIDLYYANGEENPELPEEPVDGVCPDLDETPPHNAGGYNAFYLNLGNGQFGPNVAPELGLDNFWNAMRHVWGDYDNDGMRDLMSHNFLVSTLYHAVAGPDSIVFEDASAQSGLEICIRGGTGASWVDLNNDGWLDMYAVEYREGPPPAELTHPMYINNGDGTFTDITVVAGVTGPNNSMGIAFGDYDNDGDQDVFLTNSPPTPARLYRNDGVNPETGLPHFTDVAVEAGVAVNDPNHLAVGAAWGDYNNDGRLDLLFSRARDSRLFRNDGPNEAGVWTFADVTGESGFNISGLRFWGGNFADLDNDGWLDVVLTNFDQPGPNRIFLNNRDATWREVSNALEMDNVNEAQMGVVCGDLDNDGDLDVALVTKELGRPNFIFRNDARGNNWIQLNLVGTTSNRDAVGSRITVRAAAQPGEPAFDQIREVVAGTGFFSDMPRIQTIGLGKASVVESVQIDWPSGEQAVLTNLEVNQRIVVIEGVSSACDGDANGDGLVDPLDSGFVLARFGCPVGNGNPDCDAADQNGDGTVDPLDSGFVLARFGKCQ